MPWLQACLTLPCRTDAQAIAFVEACQGSSHWKSAAVLKRWREIALDRRFPGAALRASQALGGAVRLWDDPDSAAMGQAVTLDILATSPHREARHQAAYGVKDLGMRWRHSGEVRLPEPTACIVRLLDLAQDSHAGDAWTRLYVYGFSACEAMREAPFKVDRRMSPSSPEVEARLKTLAHWYRSHRGELKARVAAEQPALLKARGLLGVGN